MDSDAELEARIRTDYEFFTNFIDMVPSHAYFDVETRAQIQGRDDEEEEEEDQIDDKRKKAKVVPMKSFHDPLRQHTISELQERLDTDNTANKPLAKSGKKSQSDSAMTDPITRLEELRENIRTKIAGLRAKRRGGLTTREEIQKAYLKKKVSNVNQRVNKKQRNMAAKTPDPPRPKLGSPSQPSAKPVFNKDGQMVFSKFDFITDSTSSYMKKKKDTSKKRGAEIYTGKDAKKILNQVEKEHKKIEELKQTDEVAAQELEDKAVWQSVIAKASGLKVKDNPELLKKAIKRKEKLTERSKKKWKQRETSVLEKKQKFQDKRKSNIQKKKDGRKSKKIDRAKKRGPKRRGGLTRREEIQKAYLKKKVSNVNQRVNKKQRNMAAKTPDPPRPKLSSPSQPSAKPVFNKDGQMVFSKFDFITDSTSSYMKKKKDASKKRGAEIYTGKDAKKILNQVEKEHKKIEELKQTDEVAAQELEDKAVWQSVIAKASGLKVKDNPELLKKAIKRKEALTERSKKKWKQRETSVLEKKQKFQDKRKSNIQKKKDGRKSKKIARAKKRGRMIPGF